ncbi:hypothetical protein [Burkholderia metallica]|uniref:hypothetical protein n=1 Tax=Burkholderia metallica TaxID=488729 RepID=UPI001CF21551|nr:hypothetical protein [Burkholderia metallica]MCA8003433.1 hypothetical protein [Burkholderia metallica]
MKVSDVGVDVNQASEIHPQPTKQPNKREIGTAKPAADTRIVALSSLARPFSSTRPSGNFGSKIGYASQKGSLQSNTEAETISTERNCDRWGATHGGLGRPLRDPPVLSQGFSGPSSGGPELKLENRFSQAIFINEFRIPSEGFCLSMSLTWLSNCLMDPGKTPEQHLQGMKTQSPGQLSAYFKQLYQQQVFINTGMDVLSSSEHPLIAKAKVVKGMLEMMSGGKLSCSTVLASDKCPDTTENVQRAVQESSQNCCLLALEGRDGLGHAVAIIRREHDWCMLDPNHGIVTLNGASPSSMISQAWNINRATRSVIVPIDSSDGVKFVPE